jgi:hypothetical protein
LVKRRQSLEVRRDIARQPIAQGKLFAMLDLTVTCSIDIASGIQINDQEAIILANPSGLFSKSIMIHVVGDVAVDVDLNTVAIKVKDHWFQLVGANIVRLRCRVSHDQLADGTLRVIGLSGDPV